jgi:hypothetical protein
MYPKGTILGPWKHLEKDGETSENYLFNFKIRDTNYYGSVLRIYCYIIKASVGLLGYASQLEIVRIILFCLSKE